MKEEKRKLRMLSLCAGIGGADLAAEATGHIEVVGQVEIDPFCQVVLEKHWPNVKRMSDIREVKGHEFGAVDIIVGGIPCQPHSLAGKRKSSADDRNLWPEFYRLICTIKPRWAMVENVLGLLSSECGAFFGTILRDLADAGYDAEWHVLRASDVGAPHERKRVFLVAYSGGTGQKRIQSKRQFQYDQTGIKNDGPQGIMAHSLNARCTTTRDISHAQVPGREEPGWQQGTNRAGRSSESNVANADRQRCAECDVTTRGSESRLAARRSDTTMAHTDRTRGSLPLTGYISTEQIIECAPSRQLESRICRNTNGVSSRLDQHIWPARPNEAQKAGEPPRTITEKIPYRNQRLKALGNAIVPQQIKPLFDAIVYVEYMEYVA